ncbi:MAG: phosphotransferase [Chloroflexi bacterium]|nr:phosphotransferase [Chloroflexota bacterium]
MNSAVYRAVAEDGAAYFSKLRRGAFDELAVALPRFYADQGIAAIIPPLATLGGRLWAELGEHAVILYHFVEGRNAYETRLAERHLRELGAALRRIHAAAVPEALLRRLPRETYSPEWREMVKSFLRQAEGGDPADPVARRVAALLRAERPRIADLVGRAERLALALRARGLPLIACHTDLHAGNLLIAGDGLHIVDWDAPLLAPKERDLMFPGAGLLGGWHGPEEEEALFYAGYGAAPVDPVALAYYRYERIVVDIAEFGKQLLLSDQGGEDRERSLGFLASYFRPGSPLEIAYQAEGRGRKTQSH